MKISKQPKLLSKFNNQGTAAKDIRDRMVERMNRIATANKQKHDKQVERCW